MGDQDGNAVGWFVDRHVREGRGGAIATLPDIDALKTHVQQLIGVWKYPRWIEVMESLPKTATGKIQRYRLRGPATA